MYMIVIDVIAQSFILYSISKKGEYSGFVGRRFPNQEKPRHWKIDPRREQHEKECRKYTVHMESLGPIRKTETDIHIESEVESDLTTKKRKRNGEEDVRNREQKTLENSSLSEKPKIAANSYYMRDLRRKIHLVRRLETVVELPEVQI